MTVAIGEGDGVGDKIPAGGGGSGIVAVNKEGDGTRGGTPVGGGGNEGVADAGGDDEEEAATTADGGGREGEAARADGEAPFEDEAGATDVASSAAMNSGEA